MKGEKGDGEKFDIEYWGTVGVAMMDKNALFHDSERIDDIGTALAMSYFDLFGTHHDRADPGSYASNTLLDGPAGFLFCFAAKRCEGWRRRG
jgi:hypothetical protein